MYDNPTLADMLDAARMHFETQVIPAIKGDARLYFQTLVAINLLRISEREAALRPQHMRAAWNRMNVLMDDFVPFPTDDSRDSAFADRNRALCAAINHGAYDPPERDQALFNHLLAAAREGMEVANPKLLAVMNEEWNAAPDAQ